MMPCVPAAQGVSAGQVSTAGIKDRRGLTCQRYCITLHPRDFPPAFRDTGGEGEEAGTGLLRALRQTLMQLNSPPMRTLVQDYLSAETSGSSGDGFVPASEIGLAVGNITFRRDKPLHTGDLWGNKFRITLRDVRMCGSASSYERGEMAQSMKEKEKGCEEVLEYLQAAMRTLQTTGFPNYFGSQRMGVLTNHAIEEKEEPTPCPSLHPRPCPCPPGPRIGKCLLLDQARLAVNIILLGAEVTLSVSECQALLGASSAMARQSCSNLQQARALFSLHFVHRYSELSTTTSSALCPSPDSSSFAKDTIKGQLQLILSLLPASLCREAELLRHLIRNVPMLRLTGSSAPAAALIAEFDQQWTQSCERALQAMSYGVKQLWVCSYQSWLWNDMVNYTLFQSQSARMEPTGKKCCGAVGDVVIDADTDTGTDTTTDTGTDTTTDTGTANSIEESKDMDMDKDNVCCSIPKLDSTTALQNKGSHLPRVVTEADRHVLPAIHTVVIPNLGKHMKYPENDVGRRYLSLLESEGLLQYATMQGEGGNIGSEKRPCETCHKNRTRPEQQQHQEPEQEDDSGSDSTVDRDLGCTVSCRINCGLAHLFHKSGNKKSSSLGIVPRGSYRHLLVSKFVFSVLCYCSVARFLFFITCLLFEYILLLVLGLSSCWISGIILSKSIDKFGSRCIIITGFCGSDCDCEAGVCPSFWLVCNYLSSRTVMQ